MPRADSIPAVHTLDAHSSKDGIAGYAAQRSRSHVANEGPQPSAKQPLIPQSRNGYASQCRPASATSTSSRSSIATKAISFLQDHVHGHSVASVLSQSQRQRLVLAASSGQMAREEERPAQHSRNMSAGLGSWAKKRHAEEASDQDNRGEAAPAQLITAELELLRSQLDDAGAENARLENKLALCQHRLQEMRVGHGADLGAEVEEDFRGLETALKRAHAARDSAYRAAASATAEADLAREALQAEGLSPMERQELALRRSWLAHYWCSAAKLGVRPEIAVSQAEYWNAVAPRPSAMGEAALRTHEDHGVDEQQQASASDMVAVERAMREAEILRLPDAVLLAAARADRDASQSAQAEDGDLLDWLSGSDEDSASVALGHWEAAELRFRMAWIANLWSRIATAGLAPDVAEDRAEWWATKVARGRLVQDDLHLTTRAIQEIGLMGVEQRLWLSRGTVLGLTA